jgi:hypothetical protein
MIENETDTSNFFKESFLSVLIIGFMLTDARAYG